MAVDKDDSAVIRADLRSKGLMDRWPEQLKIQAGYNPGDVQRYCVQDQEWQGVRLAMKQIPTHDKLRICHDYWKRKASPTPSIMYIIECQVGNYLGALRRGGQLNDQNQVRKYI